jgi:guanylate kinase
MASNISTWMIVAFVLLLAATTDAFTLSQSPASSLHRSSSSPLSFKPSFTAPFPTKLYSYERPEISEAKAKNKTPVPKVGELVRFYELDGGKQDGEELVGKLTYIQRSSSKDSSSEWLAEVTEMENVGGGYYAEYSSRRRRKSKLYDLSKIAPLVGCYVRSEDAFKIPTDAMGNVKPVVEYYDLENFDGPAAIIVNQSIVNEDLKNYGDLKNQLLKNALLAGLAGTIVAQFVGGFSAALVYFAGAIAGVGYLFFLSVKTDTLASADNKLGSSVANVRFLLPLIVLLGVAFQNLVSGGVEPTVDNIFDSVSREQFGAAMLGFLTYRLPLYFSQVGPIMGESAGVMLPGSAGIAMQMVREARDTEIKKDIFGDDLKTVLVISGPAGTGKKNLVKQLIEDSKGKLVKPTYVDRISNPIAYEQLESRNKILQEDFAGRYGLTQDSILKSAGKYKNEDGEEIDQVIVIDADVNLSKKLTSLGGIRLVGVWVGLDSLEKFENNLKDQITSGEIPISEGENAESVRRTKIREIVQDIEYGVVSGIFEFTVLNDDFDDSLLQLKNAAEYCFK